MPRLTERHMATACRQRAELEPRVPSNLRSPAVLPCPPSESLAVFTVNVGEAVWELQFLKIVGIRVRPTDSSIVTQATPSPRHPRRRSFGTFGVPTEWLASLGTKTIGVEQQKNVQ